MDDCADCAAQHLEQRRSPVAIISLFSVLNNMLFPKISFPPVQSLIFFNVVIIMLLFVEAYNLLIHFKMYFTFQTIIK